MYARIFACTLTLLLVAILNAQEKSKQPADGKQQAKPAAVAGCLTGEWAKGPEAIRGRENIAGKKVREGKKVEEEPEPEPGQRFFKVTEVEHLADTCALAEER
jgi:hypothetical protein